MSGFSLLKPIMISELERGDKFIWADEKTRRIMLCDKPNQLTAIGRSLLGVCELIEVGSYVDFRFSDSHGERRCFSYNDDCRVYRVNDVTGSSFSTLMRCGHVKCGKSWGDHWLLECMDLDSYTPTGTIFVPTGFAVEVDFFEDLGL